MGNYTTADSGRDVSAAADFDRIEQNTAKVEAGMRNPFVYLIYGVSLLLLPFTGGLSILGVIVAMLMGMGGADTAVEAATPTAADLAAPTAGCVRIICAGGALLLVGLVGLLFLAIVAYNLGVQP